MFIPFISDGEEKPVIVAVYRNIQHTEADNESIDYKNENEKRK